MQPLVSIIVSTYNRRKMLQRALESLFIQTYKNLEIIVVDDASTDTTKKYLESIKDDRLKVIYRKKNWGNDTKPKNEGIKASTGEYIAFLDSDNEYYAEAIAMRLKGFEEHPQVDVVYTDRLVVNDDDKDWEPRVGSHSDFDISTLFQLNYIDTSDVLIKRDALFLVGGFDEKYRKYIDWNLWVRMAKAALQFYHIPKVAMRYHLHKNMKSITVEDRLDKPFGNTTPQPIFRPEWKPQELPIRLGHLKRWPAVQQVAVFTLTKDRLDLTKKMYESLKSAGYPFAWYVVDNGSTDGTKEWLKSLKQKEFCVNIIDNKENVGISHGSNQALDEMMKVGYDFIIKIDNDCIIHTKNWLSELMKMYTVNWTMALSPTVEGLVENIGGAPRLGYASIQGHAVGLTHHIGGIFTMAHKSAYKNWRWSEKDFLHSQQDLIFTTHLKDLGYVCGYVEDMRAEHQLGTRGQKEAFPEYFKLREEEKRMTYGKFDPNSREHWDKVYKEEGHADPNYRHDIESFDKVLDEATGSILDIGCGNGYLLARAEMKGFKELHGFDLSGNGIDIAKTRADASFHRGDATQLPYSDAQFDTTVSTEFLEHMKDIEKVVSEIARVTKVVSLHITPYMNDCPSGEHVQQFDESIKNVFMRYFPKVEVEVFTHESRYRIENGVNKPVRLLFIKAEK